MTRSTRPLGPYFTDPGEREMLARALRNGRREVLSSPAKVDRWARGYHVRLAVDRALRWSWPDLVNRMWACPVWRGRTVVGYEAEELATDGPLRPGLAERLTAVTAWEGHPTGAPPADVRILPILEPDDDKD